MRRAFACALALAALAPGDTMARLDPPGVTAVVREARPSLESVSYATVVIVFSNATARRVRVTSYEVVWSGGRHRVRGTKLALEPGEARHHRVRVPPASGDLNALLGDAAHARVERVEVR